MTSSRPFFETRSPSWPVSYNPAVLKLSCIIDTLWGAFKIVEYQAEPYAEPVLNHSLRSGTQALRFLKVPQRIPEHSQI